MAMTKEEQRAAAERILAKSPMTAEERKVQEILERSPEMYMPPNRQTGDRVCGICGEVFENQMEKGVVVRSALELFSEHQAEHNPTSGEWSEAYHRIKSAKDSKKEPGE